MKRKKSQESLKHALSEKKDWLPVDENGCPASHTRTPILTHTHTYTHTVRHTHTHTHTHTLKHQRGRWVQKRPTFLEPCFAPRHTKVLQGNCICVCVCVCVCDVCVWREELYIAESVSIHIECQNLAGGYFFASPLALSFSFRQLHLVGEKKVF